MKQPLSVHPTYSVHITMHFSLSMVLNRSRFLSAHCARIISRIIWLDTGPIQRFRTLAVSIFCVSVLRCLILQSPSFFTLHGSEQVKISVRALCAHNLAHNMAGHRPHSTIKNPCCLNLFCQCPALPHSSISIIIYSAWL